MERHAGVKEEGNSNREGAVRKERARETWRECKRRAMDSINGVLPHWRSW